MGKIKTKNQKTQICKYFKRHSLLNLKRTSISYLHSFRKRFKNQLLLRLKRLMLKLLLKSFRKLSRRERKN